MAVTLAYDKPCKHMCLFPYFCSDMTLSLFHRTDRINRAHEKTLNHYYFAIP
jgi:hypothetical protein